MGFDFAAVKAKVRRVVHDTLGVQAFYREAPDAGAEVEIRARWHTKIEVNGDPENEGYAEVINGVQRVVLFPGDTDGGLSPVRGAVIRFPAYNVAVQLESRDPTTGADQEVWNVTPYFGV